MFPGCPTGSSRGNQLDGNVTVRGALTRNLSLISGLILFAFAATHFLNHAVGLFNLAIMDVVQGWRLAVTRSWPGAIILAAALITHIVAGLLKLFGRRTLRLPRWELTQLLLGVSVPFLLLPHIVDTRVASAVFGVQDSYLYELARLWPGSALTQSVLLVIVWAHGCLGIHHWLKLRSWYPAVRPALVAIAIAVPVAALAGFIVSGRAVAALIRDPAISDQVHRLTHWPGSFEDDKLSWLAWVSRTTFAALVALIGAAIALRQFSGLAAPKIAISYAGGPKVLSPLGPTLLEISRANGIAHASACGGRARCGTCRVRIEDGAASLAAPALAERLTLARVNAPEQARLACQIRPTAPLRVLRLVQSAHDMASIATATSDDAAAQPLCLLYLRIRDIDAIARDRLACDLLFILNEFYGAAGEAIDQNTGRVDRFDGDGLLAIFGQEHGPERGCRDALRAARAIDLALDRLNEKIAAEIGHPVQVGIGIHAGSFVVGRISLGKTSVVSVLGLGVDIAQQLASLARSTNSQVLLSVEAAKYAGATHLGETQKVTLASGSEPPTLAAVGITRGRDIELAQITESAAQPEVPASVP
ncbi:adenylate cyclase [Bradyrhizobium sp. F1.13.1]